MSGKEPLARPRDVIYAYDGSFEGFLCCVHESVYSAELPIDIAAGEAPITLLDTKYIETDGERAGRVRASIPKKISNRALSLVRTVFLSCLARKEMKMLEFLLRAYRDRGLAGRLGDPVVAPLLAAEKHLFGEAHLLKGFIRFADVGGALVAAITPKNYVLPFIAEHFILRYKEEDFLIFDKTHRAALVYRDGKGEIMQIDGIEFPEATEAEVRYQSMWKRFYDTIAIEGRENPRCRMTHMPKRYWENMPEVRGLL